MNRTKRNILSILAASVLLCGSAEAQVADYGRANGIISFEENTDPVLPGKGSQLSVSKEHAKLGSQSLLWSWKRPGSHLSIPGEIPYLPENPNPKETSVSTFVFWVYSPEVLEGHLRFAFLKDGKECCHFDYRLGFQGWRGSWVAFDRDMEGTPVKGMDEVRITAPAGVKTGRLFFDGIITSSFQDVRHHTPDWQAPFVNKDTKSHWLILNNSWKLALDITPKPILDKEDIQDMKTVRERFISLVAGNVSSYTLAQARKVYKSYGLGDNPDGTINGKPIYFVRYAETFLNLGIPDAKKTFKKNGQLLKDLNDKMLRIAISAKRAKDKSAKEEFTRMYIGLMRHLLDQGFAAGSGQGTLHHLGYSMRNFYTGPVIMQEELREAGLADQVQQAMEWFSGVGEIKKKPSEPGMDIDAFNTSLMGRVASILMLEDTPYKHAYMQALSRWIDNGLKHTEGLRACFKTDGSVVHHRKSYPAYATGGFSGAVNAVWMLAGTGLAISEESHTNLKDALLAMRFYCYDTVFPLAMSGRHPDGKGALIPEHYSRLARAGSPDGSMNTDPELAAAYLRLIEKNRAEDLEYASPAHSESYFSKQGFKAEDTPSGTEYYAFNCSMSHRYGHHLVTIAGHSRYLWAAEIYQNANHYGRYLTHGSIEILPPSGKMTPTHSGYNMEGWDWCHIPGTTAAVLPMNFMKANVLNVDEQSGYEEMLLSDEWFAGGVTHKERNGSYAMKLHEHDKYNGSLRARKSYFVFENRIVCLGSDIENGLIGADVHTTLFQNYMGRWTDDTRLDSYIDLDKGIVQDHAGNIYFIRTGKPEYRCGLQYSLHEESDEMTSGKFETAYLNHGDIVKGGRYEYMIFLPCSQDEYMMAYSRKEIDKYSHNLPYEVLRHDSSVHGVRDIATGTCAFAVFEEGKVGGIVDSCSPAMVMYSENDGLLTLSVSNPDLALYEGPSDEVFDNKGKRVERSVYSRDWINSPCGETSVSITLEGCWDLADGKGCNVTMKQENGKTVLTFRSKEARTEEITLKKSVL